MPPRAQTAAAAAKGDASPWTTASFVKDDDSQDEYEFDVGGAQRAAQDASRLKKQLAEAASRIGTAHVEVRENLLQQRRALEQERLHTFRGVGRALQRAGEKETRLAWALINLMVPAAPSAQGHTGHADEASCEGNGIGVVVDADVPAGKEDERARK